MTSNASRIRPSGPPIQVIEEQRKLIRHLRDLLDRPAAVILEIGANDGMHTRLFLEEFRHPQFQLFAFEPDPRPLTRWNIQDARCHGPFPLAIGNCDGKVTFHQSGGDDGNQSWLEDWDLSGSLHPPTGHLQMSPWVTFNRRIEVDCVKLDTWRKTVQETWSLPFIDLIWADIQGAEHDLILGGRQTLGRTRFLYSEVYDDPKYEGQQNLAQLLALLGPDWELLSRYDDNFLARNQKL